MSVCLCPSLSANVVCGCMRLKRWSSQRSEVGSLMRRSLLGQVYKYAGPQLISSLVTSAFLFTDPQSGFIQA